MSKSSLPPPYVGKVSRRKKVGLQEMAEGFKPPTSLASSPSSSFLKKAHKSSKHKVCILILFRYTYTTESTDLAQLNLKL